LVPLSDVARHRRRELHLGVQGHLLTLVWRGSFPPAEVVPGRAGRGASTAVCFCAVKPGEPVRAIRQGALISSRVPSRMSSSRRSSVDGPLVSLSDVDQTSAPRASSRRPGTPSYPGVAGRAARRQSFAATRRARREHRGVPLRRAASLTGAGRDPAGPWWWRAPEARPEQEEWRGHLREILGAVSPGGGDREPARRKDWGPAETVNFHFHNQGKGQGFGPVEGVLWLG
jgi:hypothetical protein